MIYNKAKHIIKALVRYIMPSKFIIWQGPLARKKIALTFDDGPNPNCTEKFLNLLHNYQIKATFFLIGENMEKYPHIVKKIIADGHLLGNHTYTHKNLCEISIGELIKELDRTQNIIRQISGRNSRYFRPPYGKFSFIMFLYCIHKHFSTVLWSLDSRDFEQSGVNHIVDNVIGNEIKGGDILLFHDDNEYTLEALPVIINDLKAKAFDFVRVDELLNTKN